MIITPESPDYNVDIFVASRIGSFKHIKYHSEKSRNNKKCVENLVDIKSLQKDDCVTCMEWGNKDQTEILIGKKNQQIQIYSTTNLTTVTQSADFAPGHVVGLGRCKRKLLAANSSGVVRIWSKKEETVVQTGGKLDVMKVFEEDPTMFATGGEENDLKIWSIGTPEPTFSAKNLPLDWLQLRVPVWVSGVAALPASGGALAAVCSRHGYVRLYDTRAQRRPVINVEFPKMAATCIVPSFDEKQVLVGFGRGQLHQVDLRVGKPDKGFKGAAGAITALAVCREHRLVVSASLDRHLRVHDFGTKDLLYRQYLTSKLSAVLVQSETSTPLQNAPEVKEEDEIKEEVEEEVADDLDTLFDRMETVGVKSKKAALSDDAPPAKKAKRKAKVAQIKPSTEGSTNITDEAIEDAAEADEDADEAIEDADKSVEDAHKAVEDASEDVEDADKAIVDTDEAIAKLLRSTEKTKRKREKQRKQKKAKSVFHNA